MVSRQRNPRNYNKIAFYERDIKTDSQVAKSIATRLPVGKQRFKGGFTDKFVFQSSFFED